MSKELLPKDIYHDTDDKTHFKSRTGNIPIEHVEKSENTLQLAEFELKLQDDSKRKQLVYSICNEVKPIVVQINCIRALMHLRETGLSKDLENQIWTKLLKINNSLETDSKYRRLALMAIIWEEIDPPTLTKFTELLSACAEHLIDPLLLGGLIAYARLAIAPGQTSPSWDKEKTKSNINRIQKWIKDDELNAQISIILNWITEERAHGIGPSIIRLKRALIPRGSHRTDKDDVDRLLSLLYQLRDKKYDDKKIARSISPIAMRLVDTFTELYNSAINVCRYNKNYTENEWETKLEKAFIRIGFIRPLVDINTLTNKKSIIKTVREGGAALQGLKACWFNPDRGFARQMIKPFFHNPLEQIIAAIEKGKENYAKKDSETALDHDHTEFQKDEGKKLEILCDQTIFYDAIYNIVSNIWKYVVPDAIKNGYSAKVIWSYQLDRRAVTISISDNGPGIPEGYGLFDGLRGHAKIRPKIVDYDGIYAIRNIEPRGTIVQITLHCRRGKK